MQSVGESIEKEGGTACYERLGNALQQLNQIIESENFKDIQNYWNLCDDFNADNELDRAALFNGFGNYFAALVQSQRYNL